MNPKPDVDRLYRKEKSGGKWLIIVEKWATIEKALGFRKRLRFLLLKEQEQLLTEVVIEGVISDDENPKDKQL